MKKVAKIFIILLSICFLLILAIFTYVAIIISQAGDTISLDLAKLNSYNSHVKIYDHSENELVTTSLKGTETINIEELPDYVPQAFISIEDKKFYSHKGINLGRIVKAGFNNLINGYAKEGASTITQQLIKNTHLNSEKTLSRKIQEAYLATQLEQKYDKNEILETYLNVIYFGNSAYGIESAAQNYFGHSAKELTLEESATLAGLIKSPKTYSPILNPENSLKRRNLVLKNMYDDQIITEEEYNNSVSSPIKTIKRNNNNDIFNKLLLEEAMDILDLSERDISTMGYKIYTYINKDLQNIIQSKLTSFDNIENAVVVIDNSNNSVIAYIGNAEQKRQVGSTIKPILCYAPAFEFGTLSPITPICDEEINFSGYNPKNANGKYLGWISAREALAKSLNIPAVKTLEYTGLNRSINTAKNFGISFDSDDNHLALALGATKYGENLQNMTNAYATFAKKGKFSKLNLIKRIETSSGNVVYQAKNELTQAVQEDTAFLINDILKDTIKNGTAKRLGTLDIPLCAKTGTVGVNSNNTNTDAWCIAYSPQYTVGTWYGNTTNDIKNNLLSTQNGGTVATDCNKIVWAELKKRYNLNKDFEAPKSVRQCKIDALSLNNQKIELANEKTPEMYIVSDWFSSRFAPTKVSDNFENLTAPVLKMQVNNEISLSWEGLEYQNYELYKFVDDNEELIKVFEGKNDTFTYKLPIPTENTDFYVLTKYKNQIEKSLSSNIEKFYVKNNILTKENPIKKN